MMVQIMEKFGWDYYTYMLQPNWLIDNIKRMYVAQADVKNATADK